MPDHKTMYRVLFNIASGANGQPQYAISVQTAQQKCETQYSRADDLAVSLSDSQNGEPLPK